MSCEHPLDPPILEALASGEPDFAPEALAHSRSCPECGERVRLFREMDAWLADLPAFEVGPELSLRVERLRGFSGREKSSFRLWLPPAGLFAGLLAGSAALLSVPILSGPEQAGLLAAFPAALGLEWKAVADFPSAVARALPGSVSGLSELLALQRGYAALSILLLIPAGFSIARLWMRRSALR